MFSPILSKYALGDFERCKATDKDFSNGSKVQLVFYIFLDNEHATFNHWSAEYQIHLILIPSRIHGRIWYLFLKDFNNETLMNNVQ